MMASLAAMPPIRATSVRQLKPAWTVRPLKPCSQSPRRGVAQAFRVQFFLNSGKAFFLLGACLAGRSSLQALQLRRAISFSKGRAVCGSSAGKVMAAQISMDKGTSMVPAFLRYIQVRSQQCMQMPRSVGMR